MSLNKRGAGSRAGNTAGVVNTYIVSVPRKVASEFAWRNIYF